MKSILSIALLVFAQSALATTYICEKQVTAERIEGAIVNVDNEFVNIVLTSRECASSYCSKTLYTPLKDDNLHFMLDKNSVGYILQIENSVITKLIDVGVCQVSL